MAEHTSESRRLLRHAADLVVDDQVGVEGEPDGEAPALVGSPGWMQRDRGWDETSLLDVVEQEYGLVVRWWLVSIREVIVFGTIFWFVAVTLGLIYDERASFDVLGSTISTGAWALTMSVGLRGLIEAGRAVVRNQMTT